MCIALAQPEQDSWCFRCYTTTDLNLLDDCLSCDWSQICAACLRDHRCNPEDPFEQQEEAKLLIELAERGETALLANCSESDRRWVLDDDQLRGVRRAECTVDSEVRRSRSSLGGIARARKLTDERRSEIAAIAAAARWRTR